MSVIFNCISSLSITHSSFCSIIEKWKVLFYAYSQTRRDGVEEVTETDEVSYQEVRRDIIPIWRSAYDLFKQAQYFRRPQIVLEAHR